MLRRDKSVIAASGRNRLSLDGRRSNSPLGGFGQGWVRWWVYSRILARDAQQALAP